MLSVLALLIAYGLGCSNMALYLSKLTKVDFRAAGSRNLGASNATILLGWKAGLLTAVHDAGKALLAVLAARLLCPGNELLAAAAGIACVVGHIYPAPMKFRGGKGFAPYVGMTLALHWQFALVVLCAVVVVTLLTDYIVVGTTTTVLTVPSYLGWSRQDLCLACILLIGTVIILCKHRENYRRIWAGTEFKTSAAFKRK